MPKILFICHGNICRSPMAEMVMKHLVTQRGLHGFEIDSAAVSREEIGNGVYPPARRELARQGIPCGDHRSRQIVAADYNAWDYLIGMDESNITRMLRIFGGDPEHKVHKLLEFAGESRDVSDPWYTDRFDVCYRDVLRGCEALLRCLQSEN